MAKLLNFRNDAKGLPKAHSVAVIGVGRFGESLALELMKSGTQVLGIDVHENNVQSLMGN